MSGQLRAPTGAIRLFPDTTSKATTFTSSTAASKSKLPQARPYKDFLTPLLHRRFTRAAGLTLVLCWIEAILISDGTGLLWAWFPFSMIGLRTGLLFIPCLAVFIVRVANMHVGKLTTASGFETVVAMAMSWKLVMTGMWFVYSAWIFGEVYIWTQGQDAGLGWVDLGKSYERPRVNENPVLLRWLYIFAGLVQAALHLSRDEDRVRMEERYEENGRQQEQRASVVPEAILSLAGQWSTILNRVAKLVFTGTFMGGLPTYYLFIRKQAWSLAYAIGRTFFGQLPPSAPPHGLIHPTTFFWQALSSISMLAVLWEVSNAIFTVYVSQPPIKRGQPLTSEVKDASGAIISKSVDPDGSLLRGFRSKKDVPKAFAFWELYMICTQFPARRIGLFAEIDRSSRGDVAGSAWSQTSKACLAELTSVAERARTSLSAQNKAPTSGQPQNAAPQTADQVRRPAVSDRQVKTDPNIWQRSPSGNAFGNTMKQLGDKPGSTSPLAQYAKMATDYAVHRVSAAAQDASKVRDPQSPMTQFLLSPLGEPFRQTFARRLDAVIFGVPASVRMNIIHAAKSLAKLAVCSLKEDNYGQAAKDVPTIIRVFTAAINDIDNLIYHLAPSPTDVTFDASKDRKATQDVQIVLDVLRQSLEEVLLAFGEYVGTLGLRSREVREAREAVGKIAKTEMVKVS